LNTFRGITHDEWHLMMAAFPEVQEAPEASSAKLTQEELRQKRLSYFS